MSCIAYEKVEIEETASRPVAGAETPKPFLVSSDGWDGGDPVAQRVAEVLEFELARGAMPV